MGRCPISYNPEFYHFTVTSPQQPTMEWNEDLMNKTPLNSAPARSVAQKKKKKRKERTGKQGGPNGN